MSWLRLLGAVVGVASGVVVDGWAFGVDQPLLWLPDLDRLIGAAQQSLIDLRELAHGIFPTILEESGLEAALWTLADQAGTVIQIDAMPHRWLPAATEQAAYLVVTETLTTAPSAGLTVRASALGDVLVLQLDGPKAAPTQYLLDRIGAADGTLTYHDGTLHAEIPCG